MSAHLGPLDVTFEAPIGVLFRGEMWSCIEVPGSVELFMTGGPVRVRASVDGVQVTVGLMPNGAGGHMFSISTKLRKQLGKELGDVVRVHLFDRLR
jgi:hypothetical protein